MLAENNYINNELIDKINRQVSVAFENIAPVWPLKMMVAVNPLLGFENKPFEEAINDAMVHFHQHAIPSLEKINRETIKWCQAFFDEGQASIEMPFRKEGLYHCFSKLARYDNKLTKIAKHNRVILNDLPATPQMTILYSLNTLGIKDEDHQEFLALLLTSLPGWASYVRYRAGWLDATLPQPSSIVVDYLALRCLLACLFATKRNEKQRLTGRADKLLHLKESNDIIRNIIASETSYQHRMLEDLKLTTKINKNFNKKSDAQFVFCIDVRSEPIRRKIEAVGNYETFGFAGFFGVPVTINSELKDASYASCPVLLKPKHTITEKIHANNPHGKRIRLKRRILKSIKHSYQSMKYMFTTPFMLVEALGMVSGLWMFLKTIAPTPTVYLREKLINLHHKKHHLATELTNVSEISLTDQCAYAENFLRMIGLTDNFSKLIVLCAHAAKTENNAYHSTLDCGACGGQSGAPNARILAEMLNAAYVRTYLKSRDIHIQSETIFVAGLHNTTTDEIALYHKPGSIRSATLDKLESDLIRATQANQLARAKHLPKNSGRHMARLSCDWSQTRPEWGLAGNAAFIVGPRWLTSSIDLEGRVFLHSYEWRNDADNSLLRTILTAPMIVAQWINHQYLFSTIDNVAFGSGSKVTHNVTGKIGIIQGNGSDLMHGLSLQSVFKNDHEQFHEPMRLLTIVYAPRHSIDRIIQDEAILQKLFKNEWVHLSCIDPNDNITYLLKPDLSWRKAYY